MSVQPFQPLSGLARRLVNDGVFSSDVAMDALKTARKDNKPFIAHIIENRLVSAYRAAAAAADEFGMPLFDLDVIDVESLPQGLVDEKLITKHHALPLIKRENRLYVAISDPTNIQALDEFKFHTGTTTEGVIVEEDKLAHLIDTFLDEQNSALDGLEDADLDNLEIDEGLQEQQEDSGEEAASEAPIVRFVNKILLDAIKNGASDIHFEPYEKSYRIRCRIDGILQEVAKPPSNLAPRLSARLKVMSQMDISERRMPQDGRIKMKISKNRAIDFRVNTLPTLWGEKIVLRILDPTSAQMGIEALGYDEDQKELYMQTLQKPQGMILVTGPTGSGKTVSLYTGLNILNTVERNISTAEDPVEINLEGINQVHVNNKVGLTFAEALRSFLRQDPDVVMVGEIRDIETAEIAIKAAQTGHMVLSTLHTNSAAETLTRLRNMGVPAFNIATSVSLIIAQRLGRRLCSGCKKPTTIPEATLLEEGFTQEQIAAGLNLFEHNPEGCNKCNKGYKGRVGVYETMKMTPEIAQVIMDNGSSLDILAQANAQGFRSLRKSGLRKVIQGVTSLEEMNRVIKL
ncbi:type IV-A pilus assembly ATPase PilB [Amphritea sp. 2_MG-2023]|uniref:type IV-A pilus assembly ATPase PilB n=1 Tax=Amphritea TaxID=515417 RepID=UPI001C067A85|nr:MULTISPECIES: type IV-A pilus assembly ATPase PilB [Amphritea]MBU2965175.1 type IV-A pilus assembly ATPase PilB [Amphritea atlantica]MDO6419756.1 type IV-A pilus assembly ATPase PilB [Amphritea sp. 2_MG-2023]